MSWLGGANTLCSAFLGAIMVMMVMVYMSHMMMVVHHSRILEDLNRRWLWLHIRFCVWIWFSYADIYAMNVATPLSLCYRHVLW